MDQDVGLLITLGMDQGVRLGYEKGRKPAKNLPCHLKHCAEKSNADSEGNCWTTKTDCYCRHYQWRRNQGPRVPGAPE